MTENGKLNEDIEILRAFAVLFVMVLHCNSLFLYRSELHSAVVAYADLAVGVDLFFAISGFVITASLQATFKAHPVGRGRLLAAFWIRRVSRLMPAALLWLFLCMLFVFGAAIWIDGASFQWRSLIPFAAAAANTMNLYAAYCWSASQDQILCGIPYIFGHYWTLSLEEQFYLLFPLLFAFSSRRNLVVLLGALIAAQFLWVRPIFSFGWFIRSEALCWGVLIALFSCTPAFASLARRFGRLSGGKAGLMLCTIVLVPVVGARVQGFGEHALQAGVGVVGVLSGIAVLLAALDGQSLSNALPGKRALLYVGRRSYSLYLSHLIVFAFLNYSWTRIFGAGQTSLIGEVGTNLMLLMIGFSLTLGASEGTYRFVEAPLRLRGRRLSAAVLSESRLVRSPETPTPGDLRTRELGMDARQGEV